MSAVIECIGLGKYYEETGSRLEILNNLDFSIGQGERVAILGRSGSGKTTLLNMLGGLELPCSGKISLLGKDITTISEIERGFLRNRVLGLIFQFHHLLPEFTALENVAMPLLIRGESIKVAKQESIAMLGKVGLADRISHKPAKLSGGERQRVAIARALVTRPQCILADEPTGNLDSDNAETVYSLTSELTKAIGTSFVVVTHDKALASRMDKQYELNQGQLHLMA